MITGQFREREARIWLKIIGPRGQELEVESVIDTGYDGWLTLPPAMIESLALPWKEVVRGTLADGSGCVLNAYEGTVVWDRRTRRIVIDEADPTPMVGIALLSGYELKVQVRERGSVTIKRLR